ncbi:ABC transporter permease [Kordiimonas sp.]|uniref:ABC transporter permease n=1 Tax=Kordiimonas sp. TaxID=1970157 RepID=UPI003B51E0C9
MFRNYIKIAVRNILKNRLYAAINIVGLSLGFAIYVFGNVLADYEHNHDSQFEKIEQIYTIGSRFADNANVGVLGTDGVYTAFAPILKANVEGLEAVARTVRREYLLTVGQDSYYQDIRFADPEFTQVFDLDYVEGDASVLADPSAIIVTESTARRFFGEGSVLGREVELDHAETLRVGAVVKDLPQDTHFNSSLFGTTGFEVMAPLQALSRIADYDLAGNWGNLSMGDLTYVLLPEGRNRAWLENQVRSIYEQHFDEGQKEFVADTPVRHLREVNTFIWDAIGMPVIQSIQFLGFLVLVVACVNYTNLATAQAIGRGREVGLRRTLGASRKQLLLQFLTESVTLSFISMMVAIALLEMLVPFFNGALDKVLILDYLTVLPWLVASALLVGVLSGAYPAYMITQTTPIEALREGKTKVGKGKLLRSVMVGAQFAISIFMLATVLVMYFQNQKVKDTGRVFPTEQILTLERLDVDDVKGRVEALRAELKRVPGVKEVAFSSQVPFEQSNSSFGVGPTQGDEDNSFPINQVRTDYSFISTYDIPLLAGRDFSKAFALDELQDGAVELNVIVNELAAQKLGFGSPQEALGQSFFDYPDSREPRQYNIVGVMRDQNFLGFHNKVKPFLFYIDDNRYYASIRIGGAGFDRIIEDVEAAWNRVNPDYPMQSEFLTETFAGVYNIYRSMNQALAGFAFVALALALIGLFGLAAFMAEVRTKEIGIRRVMGASVTQIVRLLIWQFSKPVVWALLVALPLAYIGSGIYLDFFVDRVTAAEVIVVGAGALTVALAWAIVAAHAVRVARSNPIAALRYE